MKQKPNVVLDKVRAFDEMLKREHREFPRKEIEALLEMRPSVHRTWRALKVLPALLRMARRTLSSRWHSARQPPAEPSGIITVHAMSPGGGFIEGYFDDGRWWTRVHEDDGTAWGKSHKREIRVTQYRSIEGCLAEPWHDQDNYYPPSFADYPARKEAPPTPAGPRELSIYVEKMYDRVLQAGRFIKWPPELQPTRAEVLLLLERYFTGLDVEIETVDYRPGGRRGFNIYLNTFPTVRHHDCGEDPETVAPQRQTIMVSLTVEYFHADAMESWGMSSALAMGLNVYMLEEVERLRKEFAKKENQIGS